MKVIYFQVKEAADKVKAIVRVATDHFAKREKLVILAPNQSAAEYLDLLLWRFPEESFLPHATDGSELIHITEHPEATTEPTIFFNLCPDPLPSTLTPQLIYEIEDLSSPEGQESFKKRFQTYRDKEFAIQLSE